MLRLIDLRIRVSIDALGLPDEAITQLVEIAGKIIGDRLEGLQPALVSELEQHCPVEVDIG